MTWATTYEQNKPLTNATNSPTKQKFERTEVLKVVCYSVGSGGIWNVSSEAPRDSFLRKVGLTGAAKLKTEEPWEHSQHMVQLGEKAQG